MKERERISGGNQQNEFNKQFTSHPSTKWIRRLNNPNPKKKEAPATKVGRYKGSLHIPITLLSPLVKLLEKLSLPTMSESIKPAGHKHVFRKSHNFKESNIRLNT
ncbi:hypothetical protein ACFFRR_011378 [Megaselia abdita]